MPIRANSSQLDTDFHRFGACFGRVEPTFLHDDRSAAVAMARADIFVRFTCASVMTELDPVIHGVAAHSSGWR